MKMTEGSGQARRKIKIKKGERGAAAAPSGEGEEGVQLLGFFFFFLCCLPLIAKLPPLLVCVEGSYL